MNFEQKQQILVGWESFFLRSWKTVEKLLLVNYCRDRFFFQMSKRVNHLVVDSSAFIRQAPLHVSRFLSKQIRRERRMQWI